MRGKNSPAAPRPGPAFTLADTHHHYWDLRLGKNPWLCQEPPLPFRYGDYSALRRNYLPADYARDSAGFRVSAAVVVEAEWDPSDPTGETRWLHELLAVDPVPRMIVAQAWLDREDVEDVLAAQAAFPRVRGVRHKPRAASAPDQVRRGLPGSMDDPKWRRGYALLSQFGLSFDLQTPWWHMAEAAQLAMGFPGTPLIINHAGLPADRSPEGLAGWRRAMEAVAGCPNVSVKISGLGQPGVPWTVELQRPVVQTVIRLFGAERCMFASNYPVDSLVASYRTIYEGFQDIVKDFPAQARDALFAGNARRIYRIG